MNTEYGYCKCGCGKKTKIVNFNFERKGYVKGEPYAYIKGHHTRVMCSGSDNYNWNGGRKVGTRGYIYLYSPEHPRSTKKYVREQILVAEMALGKPLPVGAVVHHANGITADNSSHNLVICENQEYHLLLHRRMRAIAAGHPAYWRKCKICHEYDDPTNDMFVSHMNHRAYHNTCMRDYQNMRRKIRMSKEVEA